MTNQMVEPTASDLMQMWHGHVFGARCPGCAEEIGRCALVDIAYRFASCDCGTPEYGHLVEQAWHIGCMAERAPEIEAANMLDSAAYYLNERRTRVRIDGMGHLVDRIRSFTERFKLRAEETSR